MVDESGVAPFEVGTETDLGDLTEVKSQDLLPAGKNLLVEIKKAKIRSVGVEGKKPVSQENPEVYRFLALEAVLVDGIPVVGSNGEQGIKFKGKVVFPELMIWANPEIKVTDYWKSKKYLINVKEFLIAIGFKANEPPKINDEFCQGIKGQQVRLSISLKKIQVQDATGAWIDTDDEKNDYRYWRKA